MKIICLPAGYDFYTKRDDPLTVYTRLGCADVKFDNCCCEYFGYGRWFWETRRIAYGDSELRIERTCDDNIIWLSSFQSGHYYLVNDRDIKLNEKPEIEWLLAHVSFSKRKKYEWRNSIIVSYLCERRRKWSLVLANLKTGEVLKREDLLVKNIYLLDDLVILFNFDDWHTYGLDHNLNTIWKFRPSVNFASNNVRGPEVYQDLVIISYGTSRSEKLPGPVYEGIQCADQNQSFDSNLYALNIEDGCLCWHISLPKTIDNMIIKGENLYISSTNEIHVINPLTGKTQKIVETGLSEFVDQSLDPSSLYIQGDKLYFCHQVDACLLVYDLYEMRLIKRINIPEPYTIKDFEYHHEATGKLYFNLAARFPRLYYHTSPILELDPNDLDSGMELMTGPPVDIEMRASESNSNEREIWITIRDIPLDEAMVYAEMYTEDQAFYHGVNGQYQAMHKTDEFNGKVHFRYSGGDRPIEEIEQKLRILEKRFADWGRTIAFASTDPNQNATLEALYLE